MRLSDEEKKLAAEMLPNAGELREKVQTRLKTKRDEGLRSYLQHAKEKIDEAVAKDQLVAQVEVPVELVEALTSLLDSQGFACYVEAYSRTKPPERQLVTIKWEEAQLPPKPEAV